jgi:hypothetical protein
VLFALRATGFPQSLEGDSSQPETLMGGSEVSRCRDLRKPVLSATIWLLNTPIESIMMTLIEHIQPQTDTNLLTRSYSNSFTNPQLDENQKLLGPQLVIVWLIAILGSWGLAGLLVYGGFKMISMLFS